MFSSATWPSLFTEWFHTGLVLLVVACPCALVISTPITMVCGLQRAARSGLLVKGADSLEAAAEINAIALDKTGTLTVGHPQVTEVVTADGCSRDDVLRTAAAVERQSAHPIARAIVAAAAHLDEQQGNEVDVSSVVATPGKGISAQLDGRPVRLGNFSFATEALNPPQQHVGRRLEADPASGVSCVYVSTDRLLGRIELADALRADAAQAIVELHQSGIDNIVMMTGDRRSVGSAVAQRLGIGDVQSELLPADKVERVQAMRAMGYRVAMVGDGFNDAPALASADLGIAMGSDASGLAVESADIVVLSPQLSALGRLLRLAKVTRTRLWQNIVLSLAIKGLVLLATFMGYGTMWLAVAADVGASLLVIFNGMRLLGAKIES